MDIYRYTPKKSFTVSHILWPLLAAVLAAAIYLYLTSQVPAHLVTNHLPAVTMGTPRQMIVANVMDAFDESTLIATTASSTATTTVSTVTIDASSARANEVTSAQPVLAPKLVPNKLSKTSTKTTLPKLANVFHISLATSTVSVSAMQSAATAATSTPVVIQTTSLATTTLAVAPQATSSQSSSTSVPSLTPTPYVAQISGDSVALPPPPPAPVLTVPDAPTSLSATAGNAQVSLSWSAPVNTGNTGLTDYEIRQSIDNFVADNTLVNDGVGTSSTAYVVTGLTNGTLYYFKVSAVNSVGTSTASNIGSTTPVAPVTVPGAPTSLSGKAGDSNVSLAWTAPANNGGSVLTDYEVHYSIDNFVSDSQTFAHMATTTTSMDVTGLTNGTAYYFLVKAVNAVGASAASNIAGPYTPIAAAPPPPPPGHLHF